MPLVEIICKEKVYPPRGVPYIDCDTGQQTVTDLCIDIPGLIAYRSEKLGLGEGLPADVVEVDVRDFHPLAQNATDIAIRVIFTEVHEEADRKAIRDELIDRFRRWFVAHPIHGCSMSLDIFFGPSHGCIVDQDGKLYQTW